MAEAIARVEAARSGRPAIEVGSAGTFALRDEPASEPAEIVARRHGLDLGSHRARPLLPELVGEVDLVVGMTPAHVAIAREMAGGVRTELLTTFLPEGHELRGAPVPDPAGGSLERYEETFRLVREAVEGLLERLDAEPGEG